jgi:multidrug efflux pump subunit AcrA (membrane-fusion protein)
LSVEGEAFEQDSQFIFEAMEKKSPVSAILDSQSAAPVVVDGLQIQFVSSRVEPESRALHFYVSLPNKLVRDTGPDTSPRFIDWQYKPGQRMLLRIPVERWAERIVLPINAIAQDGVEMYVFRANGDHFDRQPVRVEYRDPLTAVIANDGSLFPGDEVALSGAQQLQLALKNKSGGGVDPHAGHNH